jgi:hypothetical protein
MVFQALTLSVLGKVDPELEYQCTLVDQHRLEAVELVHPLVEIGSRHAVADSLGNRLANTMSRRKSRFAPSAASARQ